MSVISKSRRIAGEEDSRTVPIDFKDWQKIQNLFARIVGANISFIDSSGNYLVKTSRITPFCFEWAEPLDRSVTRPVDCVVKAFQEALQGKKAYHCIHCLHFLSLKVRLDGNLAGFIIIGPLLTGTREREDVYRNIAIRLGLNQDQFLDGLRELKLFSHAALKVILDFLEDITEHYLNQLVQRQELKHLIPSFSSRENEINRLFSMVYSTELSNSLLDIAMALVKGDSGSVLLFDKKERCFHMQAARSIPPQYMNGRSISLEGSVSGWVAREGKPILIRKSIQRPGLKKHLKRSELKSSFVIPITFQNEMVGILCLNSKSTNKKFDQNNLILLDQLGKLASIAFRKLSNEKK